MLLEQKLLNVSAVATVRDGEKQQEKVIKAKMQDLAAVFVRDLKEVRCLFKEEFQKEDLITYLPK